MAWAMLAAATSTPGANSSAAGGEIGVVAVLERHAALFPFGRPKSIPSELQRSGR